MAKRTTQLRSYQQPVLLRVLQSVANNDGDQMAVMMSRQSGKNETSARTEAHLMVAYRRVGGAGIKAAPTLKPQAQVSSRRLQDHLRKLGLARRRDYSVDGMEVHLGNARYAFSTASPDANVVGQTASILLEGDEAQDIDAEVWDKNFRPMAANYNTTSVLWGTAWTEDTLLQHAIDAGVEAERRDGRRRVFIVPWWEVAEAHQPYGRYVENERARLGQNHPIFQTQYELRPLAGAGRLLNESQLLGLRGSYERQFSPQRDVIYVAGLDVAGEDTPDVLIKGRDSTVLSIARVTARKSPELPLCDVVQAYEWRGKAHDSLYAEIMTILDGWRCQLVAIDTTGVGEALGILAVRALGESRVIKYRFTERTKSGLGYDLQAAATTGSMKLWANDGSQEYSQIDHQLRRARAEYKPNQTVSFFVPANEGHDDFLMSLALVAHAAKMCPPPQIARGRKRGIR